MKKIPALKLDQQKLLGFKILTPATQDNKQSELKAGFKIDSKIGGKIGSKPGIKVGRAI